MNSVELAIVCMEENTNNPHTPSHSITCAGVAVQSAVERKELLQFPVVKEVAH